MAIIFWVIDMFLHCIAICPLLLKEVIKAPNQLFICIHYSNEQMHKKSWCKSAPNAELITLKAPSRLEEDNSMQLYPVNIIKSFA